jgi:electron transport complex protein RnfE
MKILFNGILNENPILVIMIGLCPTLAVSTSAVNSLGMCLAATFVLICSNMVISAIRKIVPDDMRIPIFIIVISTFVTVIDLSMQAYLPSLYKALGIFVPLIVVNCIILGRGEAFAYRRNVVDSMLDGIGMGLGFTLIIVVIGTIREILGNGTFFGSKQFIAQPALIMILPPGAFMTIGTLMALMRLFKNREKKKEGCKKEIK